MNLVIAYNGGKACIMHQRPDGFWEMTSPRSRYQRNQAKVKLLADGWQHLWAGPGHGSQKVWRRPK